MRSSIQVSAELRQALEARKLHPRQSYEEVILKALEGRAPEADPSRARLPPKIQAAWSEALAGIRREYGDRFLRAILYGSFARGDAREDSDVDVLLVLSGEVEPTREISRIVRITYEILLERGVHLSVMPISESDFLTRASPLLMNVRRDGVPL